MYAKSSTGCGFIPDSSGVLRLKFSCELLCPVCNHYTTVTALRTLRAKTGLRRICTEVLRILNAAHACTYCGRTLQRAPRSVHLITPAELKGFFAYGLLRQAETLGLIPRTPRPKQGSPQSREVTLRTISRIAELVSRQSDESSA